MMETPAVGAAILCLMCAYEKPWGIFSNSSGAAICIECRDKVWNHENFKRALENCRMMASRRLAQTTNASDREAWEHVMRFCAEVGILANPIQSCNLVGCQIIGAHDHPIGGPVQT